MLLSKKKKKERNRVAYARSKQTATEKGGQGFNKGRLYLSTALEIVSNWGGKVIGRGWGAKKRGREYDKSPTISG